MASRAAVTPLAPPPQPKPRIGPNIAVERKVHHERAPFTQGAKHVALYIAARLAWDEERGEFNAFVMEETIAAAVGDGGKPKSTRQVSRWIRELVTPGPWQMFEVTGRARGRGYEPLVTRGQRHRCNRYALVFSAVRLNVARAMKLTNDTALLLSMMPSASNYGSFGSDATAREFRGRELAFQAQHLRGDLSQADLDAAVARLRHEYQGVLTFPAQ